MLKALQVEQFPGQEVRMMFISLIETLEATRLTLFVLTGSDRGHVVREAQRDRFLQLDPMVIMDIFVKSRLLHQLQPQLRRDSLCRISSLVASRICANNLSNRQARAPSRLHCRRCISARPRRYSLITRNLDSPIRLHLVIAHRLCGTRCVR